MSVLTEGRTADLIESPKRRVSKFAVLATEIMYQGGMLSRGSDNEIKMAADTAGQIVEGMVDTYVDNTDDGETLAPALEIRLMNNSATSAVTRSMIGRPCFVEDDNTVAGITTNFVAAGLVYDVTDDGVFVDMRPTSLALARTLAPPVLTAKVDDYTVTAAEAFAGNRIFSASKDGGMALTLPSAVPGMRLGIFRLTATAAYDVSIQAGAGDTVLGSTAAKKVTNAVDAQSQVLWLVAGDAGNWIADNPMPSDIASWVIDNT
ncbi:MAG: hypothetical protein RRC34_02870 [Lentisphaeria bacterium]|nr:hypothetical protein [Lentisphaeria bacterium]